ncbi:MAG: hypothetical protein JO270_00180 [Acidobacteriaceae bacterium]|nr:hypothetical protein [Acidobacteriaceae bacterium]
MSDEEKKPEGKEEPTLKNRVFMTRAYLKPIDKELYGLFRDVVEEDAATGKREKLGKPIGPIKVLRKKRQTDPVEAVRVRTVHPKTGEALELVEWEG